MASAADKATKGPRTSVWLEGPTARGRRSDRSDHPKGLDRDRIIEVSVRLLDADGPAKFSMRRLAAELGVTAMSLYWYVDTKDDLLELALDSVYSEMKMEAGAGKDSTATGRTPEVSDWRDDLRSLAAAFRALLVRHPWVSPLVGRFLNIGPHATGFSAAVERVVRRTGLPEHGRRGALAAVFQFVYGFGTIEGHFVQRCAEAGMTQEQYCRNAIGRIHEQPEQQCRLNQFDQLDQGGEAGAPRGGDTVEETRERDFAFALELLVAGIESMRSRA